MDRALLLVYLSKSFNPLLLTKTKFKSRHNLTLKIKLETQVLKNNVPSDLPSKLQNFKN